MKFNEDTRVKIPATIQFLKNGYEYQSKKDADIDRDTRIFIDRFKNSIESINNTRLSDEELAGLLDEIHQTIKNNDMGKSFYKWLKNPHSDQLKLIDFENIDNNDFAVVTELTFGPQRAGSFRPDITVLINGIPLAFLEVKPPNNEGGIQAEFDRMLNQRLETPEFKKYFNMLQIVSFSNNMEYEDDDDVVDPQEVKAGSFYTTPNGFNTSFSFFRDEKPKDISTLEVISEDTIRAVLEDNGYSSSHYDSPEFQTNLDPNSPANRFVSSLFDKQRLLYYLQYGISYLDGAVTQKHIMRYPQFFASRAILDRIDGGGKSGIIFHTQGSGKTGLAYFSTSILKDYFAKKNASARFYYVVDRLDLLNQVSSDMKRRGLTVTNVNSKKEFEKELNKPIAYGAMDSTGEMTVVNIQKFDSDMPVAENDYNANIQRIIFVDEAHRSYAMNGEFFKNLMTVDRDAIFIALTGTPLLSKKERSNLKFGDYIHKYFYDKSIADGYTLQIKKENIKTTERTEIRNNLELENPTRDSKAIKESEDYINALGKFIDKDFKNFRYTNDNDKTIGGMVVCCSNLQAKKVKKWFDENSDLKAGLVISNDDESKKNKQTQIAFKENPDELDILVVHQMLTTGYDVPRLKKMYLLRNAKEHTLLQTISRVNRPYRSPNGNFYKYGYITDFVDIEEEYDRTIEAYLKEMADGMEEEGVDGSLSGLVVSPEDIYNKYLKLKKELDGTIDTTNLELFSQALVHKTREELLTIRRLLNGIKTSLNEFLLSNCEEYAKEIDKDHIQKLLKETQNRIDFINLKTHPTKTMNIISNEEVLKIFYEFIKVKTEIVDLSKFTEEFEDLGKTISDIKSEISKSRDPEQAEIVLLDQYLKELFEKLDIEDLDSFLEIHEEFKKVLEDLKKINEENEKILKRYNGNFAFVKTLKDTKAEHPEFDSEMLAQILDIIYEKTKALEDSALLAIQGRDTYVSALRRSTIKDLKRNGYFRNTGFSREELTELLRKVYKNLKKY